MVSSASGGGAGRSAGGRSGRASSFCSQVRHSGDAGEGGSPEFRARHSAASAPLTRGELSRTSSRKVENRNASTSRRTGRTRRSAARSPRAATSPSSSVRKSAISSSAVRYAAVSGAVSRRSALVSVASSLRSMHVTNCRYTSPRLRCWIRSASPDAASSRASASRNSGAIGAARSVTLRARSRSASRWR